MKLRRITALVLTAVVLLSLCACGKSSSNSYSTSYAKTDYAMPAAAPTMYAAEEGYAADSYYEPAEAEAAYGGFSANAGSTADIPSDPAATINPEKIIYSAYATLETTTYDDTIAKLSAMIESYGGFIESSSVSGANYYSISHGTKSLRSANYTIRVPSSSFSGMMSELPQIGNVPYSNTYTENITSQYYDTQAHLNAYKTQENRLLEMMELAETVEDVIIIEDRLTELRYRIESLQSSLNNWDRKVSYSTINLEVQEVSEYTPTEPVRVTYGEKLSAAVRDGLESVGDFFADFLLWFLEALPTLIILAVIVIVIIRIIKKRAGNKEARKAKREARKAAKAEAKAAKKAANAPAPSAPSAPEDKAE